MAFATDLEASSSQYWSRTDALQSGLDFSGDFSISARIKIETLPSVGTSAWIVTKYGFENNQRAYAFGIKNIADTYSLTVITSSNGSSTTEINITWPSPSQGVWYRVGLSKSSTTATVYLDGSSLGSGTVDSSIFNSSATFAIGCAVGGSGGFDGFFDGIIDNVLVYNTAIGSNMALNTPCSPYLTGAVSYWAFESTGNDSVGSNTLTNNNTATFVSDSAFCISVTESATLNEAVRLSPIFTVVDSVSLSDGVSATNIGGPWNDLPKSSSAWSNLDRN